MDPIYPIVPGAPGIPPVLPPRVVGRVDPDGRGGAGDPGRRRQRRGEGNTGEEGVELELEGMSECDDDPEAVAYDEGSAAGAGNPATYPAPGGAGEDEGPGHIDLTA